MVRGVFCCTKKGTSRVCWVDECGVLGKLLSFQCPCLSINWMSCGFEPIQQLTSPQHQHRQGTLFYSTHQVVHGHAISIACLLSPECRTAQDPAIYRLRRCLPARRLPGCA